MSEDPRALVARLLAQSPFAMPREDALEHVRARREQLLAHRVATPEPDFTAPEPMPVADPVHDVSAYARDFWARKKSSRPKKPPGRRPQGELGPEHDRFRVVDGDRGDDGDKEP